MYLSTKNELYRSKLSKVRSLQTQTDATEHITMPYSQVVIIYSYIPIGIPYIFSIYVWVLWHLVLSPQEPGKVSFHSQSLW